MLSLAPSSLAFSSPSVLPRAVVTQRTAALVMQNEMEPECALT